MFQTSFNGKRKGFLLVRCCTSKASTGRFHFVVQRSRTRTIMKGPKKCEVFFSFKLSLYRWFCFPKNQIQNKRNYQVLSPTVEPQYNEGPRDWQTLLAITRFRYIEVLFHVFYYYWGKENRSLYAGLRYIEFRYIEVPLTVVFVHWLWLWLTDSMCINNEQHHTRVPMNGNTSAGYSQNQLVPTA